MSFRNVAIIAHVDHGKTTLVDGLLHQCHAFQAHEQVAERVMDSMDLERERGITITSKNTAVSYQGVKINIVDTPGHVDFGGEVERVLEMVDGALLLVDASEGPLPQTRFVLRKAMDAGLALLVCINKIDRPDARTTEVLDEIYDLFIDLDAEEDQLEFPVLLASAKAGVAHRQLDDGSTDLFPLLDTLVSDIPPPTDVDEGEARLRVTMLDYDPYVGRLAIGRLVGGSLSRGQLATWFGERETRRNVRVQLLYTWSGLRRHEVDRVEAGDVVAVAGIEGITVGDTLATGPEPLPMPRLRVDEPTIGMTLSVNSSPLSGQEGRYLTGRQIRQRLERELMSNVSLRMDGERDAFKVWGRGELQLAVLVEQMRREGFELSLSRPEVATKERADGTRLEPWELVVIDVPDQFVGAVTQALGARRGRVTELESRGSGRSRLVFRVPSRGLIGFRSELLTETRGEAVVHTIFDGWDKAPGFYRARTNGAMVADRSGRTTTYALYHLQPRGTLFVSPGARVYEGLIVGEHVRINDLNVNACKEKHLTNVRSAGADEKLLLSPPRVMGLDAAIAFIDEDEWVEVTPKSIRLRKQVLPGNQRSIVRRERPPPKDKVG